MEPKKIVIPSSLNLTKQAPYVSHDRLNRLRLDTLDAQNSTARAHLIELLGYGGNGTSFGAMVSVDLSVEVLAAHCEHHHTLLTVARTYNPVCEVLDPQRAHR